MVVPCACKLILLYSFVFFLVRTVHKFEFRHGMLYTENTTSGKLCKERDAVIEMYVLDSTCIFSL